jgi:hypothetical protein
MDLTLKNLKITKNKIINQENILALFELINIKLKIFIIICKKIINKTTL